MVGGLVTSFVLELTVYPAIFALWKGRRLPRSLPSLTPQTWQEVADAGRGKSTV
jgi:hypothetical protein